MTETVEQVSPAAHGKERAANDAGRTTARELPIALLTGGGDKPYALGLVETLVQRGLQVDFIGSDQLDCPSLRSYLKLIF